MSLEVASFEFSRAPYGIPSQMHGILTYPGSRTKQTIQGEFPQIHTLGYIPEDPHLSSQNYSNILTDKMYETTPTMRKRVFLDWDGGSRLEKGFEYWFWFDDSDDQNEWDENRMFSTPGDQPYGFISYKELIKESPNVYRFTDDLILGKKGYKLGHITFVVRFYPRGTGKAIWKAWSDCYKEAERVFAPNNLASEKGNQGTAIHMIGYKLCNRATTVEDLNKVTEAIRTVEKIRQENVPTSPAAEANILLYAVPSLTTPELRKKIVTN